MPDQCHGWIFPKENTEFSSICSWKAINPHTHTLVTSGCKVSQADISSIVVTLLPASQLSSFIFHQLVTKLACTSKNNLDCQHTNIHRHGGTSEYESQPSFQSNHFCFDIELIWKRKICQNSFRENFDFNFVYFFPHSSWVKDNRIGSEFSTSKPHHDFLYV